MFCNRTFGLNYKWLQVPKVYSYTNSANSLYQLFFCLTQQHNGITCPIPQYEEWGGGGSRTGVIQKTATHNYFLFTTNSSTWTKLQWVVGAGGFEPQRSNRSDWLLRKIGTNMFIMSELGFGRQASAKRLDATWPLFGSLKCSLALPRYDLPQLQITSRLLSCF